MLKVFSTLNRSLNSFCILGDALADADTAAELLFEIRGGAQVIRMGVGLEDPVDLEHAPAHERHEILLREIGLGPGGRLIEVERGVDDRTVSPLVLLDHVSDRVGLFAEEPVDLRVHAPPPSARPRVPHPSDSDVRAHPTIVNTD